MQVPVFIKGSHVAGMLVWELWSCPWRHKRPSLWLQGPHPHQALHQHRRVRGQSLKCLFSILWFWTPPTPHPPAILVGAPNFKMTSLVYFCCHRLELWEIAGVCLWTLSLMVKINGCSHHSQSAGCGYTTLTAINNDQHNGGYILLWFIIKSGLLSLTKLKQ